MGTGQNNSVTCRTTVGPIDLNFNAVNGPGEVRPGMGSRCGFRSLMSGDAVNFPGGCLMKIEASSVVNRPVGDVWKLLADTSTWPKWAPVYLELSQTSAGPVDVGATFHSKHPQNRVLNERLIEYEPNRRFAFEFTSGPIKGSKETYIMEEMADGGGKITTKLTREFDLKFRGLFKVLGPLLVTPGFRRERRVEVDNVRRLLEQSDSSSTGTPSPGSNP